MGLNLQDLAVNALLIAALAFFIRRWISSTDADVKAARTESATATAALGARFDKWTEAVEKDINALGERMNKHQLEVAEKYVSFPRLEGALRPINDGLHDLKTGQERIFDRLDGKQDKAGHGHD